MDRIATQRLLLRRMQAEDWEPLMHIWQALALTEYAQYDKPHPTTPENALERLKKWDAYRESTEHLFFAVCLADRIIGYAAFNICPAGYELGYGFHPAIHGKGYAAEALGALLKELHLPCVTAGTALANQPSVRLLEKLGFVRKGTEQVSFYRNAEGEPIVFTGGIYQWNASE